MSFKRLRKVASSFLSKKSTIIHSGSDKSVVLLPRSSLDTIRPAAIQLEHLSSFDTVHPIVPVIHVEDADSGNSGEYQEKEEGLCGIDGQKRRGSEEEWAEKTRQREQMYPPPKMDDGENVIETRTGYIRKSRRKLALWNRGWVNLDTWLEDEMKKMEADPEYQPMGCGL